MIIVLAEKEVSANTISMNKLFTMPWNNTNGVKLK